MENMEFLNSEHSWY